MERFVYFVQRYMKFLIAAAAGIVALLNAVGDGKIDGGDLSLILAAILGPFGVALFPNAPKEKPPFSRS